jgi:dTDP-4-amino-4,6-dideoxygalactose transaminase
VTERPRLQPADPKADFLADEDAIRAAIDRVLTRGRYILGDEVQAFEAVFADFLGGGFVIGVANGTDALELALRAAGVRPGDVVATVANTVSATAAAIEQIGARPLFVEIEADTLLMSATALERELDSAVIRAVLPVHLYGNPADMRRIGELCAAREVPVVEDCAQSHGATFEGRKTGTFGQLAAFSFYPTKNLGAIGDGGAVFSRDSSLADEVRLLRQYGWRTRYISEIPGRNSRLDEMQAAILRAKLPSLGSKNAARAAIAARYNERLEGGQVALPAVTPGGVSVWHQYPIRTRRRNEVQETLREAGIDAAALYPVPLHHQPAYLQTGVRLPITEAACREVLCLPCHPGLDAADVDRVCEVILS